MTAIVHVSYYKGLAQLPTRASQFSSNDVVALQEPRISGEQQSVGVGTATDFAAAPDGTSVARIQVEDSQVVKYEVIANSAQTIQTASSTSPAISGEVIIAMSPGWYLSFIDAA